MGFPFGETVIRHARTLGTADAQGNDTWTDTDTTVKGVAVYPRESVELVQGQDTNIIGLVAVFKPAITVAPADQFTVRGERWDVDAMPGQYHSPLTATELTKVNLTRATG